MRHGQEREEQENLRKKLESELEKHVVRVRPLGFDRSKLDASSSLLFLLLSSRPFSSVLLSSLHFSCLSSETSQAILLALLFQRLEGFRLRPQHVAGKQH